MAEQPQTTKIALVVVLAVTLAIILLMRSGLLPTGAGESGPGAPTSPTGESATPAPGDGGTPLRSQSAWSRPDPVGPIGRDPTQIDLSHTVVSPNVTSVTVPVSAGDPEYTVAGIMYSTEQPSSVIIDGHVLHEGDTVNGAVIVKISEGSAELRRGDTSWIVKPGEQYRGSEAVRSEN